MAVKFPNPVKNVDPMIKARIREIRFNPSFGIPGKYHPKDKILAPEELTSSKILSKKASYSKVPQICIKTLN